MVNLEPNIRRAYHLEYIRLNRQRAWDFLKDNPCVDCGETDPVVLDFDHVDPSIKHRDVSKMLSGTTSWNTIKKEIDKCVIRCANCHRRRTATQFDYYKGVIK